MAKPFHLQPLVDLARDRSEAAAQSLAKLKQLWQEAENKRTQLQVYLAEYQSRLHQQSQSGLTALQWRDYQAFMHKLELAIQAQSQEIERCRLAWEAGQTTWQACEREVNAYQTLRKRHEESERKVDEKQDQRLQDEFARNLHRLKDTSAE
jgi:flagellar FliJ protein